MEHAGPHQVARGKRRGEGRDREQNQNHREKSKPHFAHEEVLIKIDANARRRRVRGSYEFLRKPSPHSTTDQLKDQTRVSDTGWWQTLLSELPIEIPASEESTGGEAWYVPARQQTCIYRMNNRQFCRTALYSAIHPR